MKKIGLTGGIGSGKTIVAKIFEILKIPVYYSDERAKYILSNHPEVKSQLIKTFGQEIYDNGAINKKKLAQIVFDEAQKLAQLNAIIHPLVKEDFNAWCQAQDTPYIIKEAAILFETGTYKELDEIICVIAPEKIRIQRVIERDRVSKEQVLQRMQHQWTDEQRIKKSDYIVQNDETQLVIPQVLEIHEKLLQQ